MTNRKFRIKMAKQLTIIILLLAFGFSSKAQSERTQYLGINIIPLFSKQLELGYEMNLKPNITLEAYTGYVFNTNMDSPFKKGTEFIFSNKSGYFIKFGGRYNIRKDLSKFAPFIGVNIVNAIAIEEGEYDKYSETPGEPVKRDSYNLGLSGVIGVTSPANKRINADLGLQIGGLLVNNLIDFHSYMPGMGVNYGSGVRIQAIARIKYRIK